MTLIAKPLLGELDLFAQQAALERVAEAQERTDGRVQRSAHEEELVRILTDYAIKVVAIHYVHEQPLTFHADHLGAKLDEMGVARDNSLRRRIISVCINRGKAEGLWRKVGKVMGRAGREITLWEVNR